MNLNFFKFSKFSKFLKFLSICSSFGTLFSGFQTYSMDDINSLNSSFVTADDDKHIGLPECEICGENEPVYYIWRDLTADCIECDPKERPKIRNIPPVLCCSDPACVQKSLQKCSVERKKISKHCEICGNKKPAYYLFTYHIDDLTKFDFKDSLNIQHVPPVICCQDPRCIFKALRKNNIEIELYFKPKIVETCEGCFILCCTKCNNVHMVDNFTSICPECNINCRNLYNISRIENDSNDKIEVKIDYQEIINKLNNYKKDCCVLLCTKCNNIFVQDDFLKCPICNIDLVSLWDVFFINNDNNVKRYRFYKYFLQKISNNRDKVIISDKNETVGVYNDIFAAQCLANIALQFPPLVLKNVLYALESSEYVVIVKNIGRDGWIDFCKKTDLRKKISELLNHGYHITYGYDNMSGRFSDIPSDLQQALNQAGLLQNCIKK